MWKQNSKVWCTSQEHEQRAIKNICIEDAGQLPGAVIQQKCGIHV